MLLAVDIATEIARDIAALATDSAKISEKNSGSPSRRPDQSLNIHYAAKNNQFTIYAKDSSLNLLCFFFEFDMFCNVLSFQCIVWDEKKLS